MFESEGTSLRRSQLCAIAAVVTSGGVAPRCLQRLVRPPEEVLPSAAHKLSVLHKRRLAWRVLGRRRLPRRSLRSSTRAFLRIHCLPAVLLQRVDFHSQLQQQQVGSKGKRELLRRTEGELPVPGNIATMSGQRASPSFSIVSFPQIPFMWQRTVGSTSWRFLARFQSPAVDPATSVGSLWS